MSLLVVGYLNGRRVVVDEGESRARVAGYGGSALGHAITVIPPSRQPGYDRNAKRNAARKRARAARKETRSG
jgi:hypothetical protein